MKRKYLFFLLLSLIPYFAYNQIDTVVFDQITAEHHLQIVKLKDKVSTPQKKYKIKTPIEFNSFAFGWQIDTKISPSDIIVYYRVHKKNGMWTDWKKDEAYITPDETRWQMYQTNLLFGIDEGLNDKIEFFYDIPQNTICRGLYLILQNVK
jgi:hypothetical protein